MQTVVYTIHLPVINEIVRISSIPEDYIVDTIENQQPPYDSVLIRPLDGESLSRLVIINGKWKVEAYNEPHDITFHNRLTQPLITTATRPLIPIPAPNNITNDPYQIKVGNVGTYSTGGKVGREYWNGFEVIEIISPGKSIRVAFDDPLLIGKEEPVAVPDLNNTVRYYIPEEYKFRILQYRRPGKWMFKGVPAKDMHGSITIGTKRTGGEEGIF